MLSENSILRRLPAQLNRRQTIFIDGMRHAAEIADLAYNRLVKSLTEIAQNQARTNSVRQTDTLFATRYISAFLDAWAFVDATDRLRALSKQMPNVGEGFSNDNRVKSFMGISEEIRSLRNVADHLAQRVDYVIANESTALGILTWVTCVDDFSDKHITCVLRPGTNFAQKKMELVNPAGQFITRPTSLIHLAAGEYRACLSDVFQSMNLYVEKLEESLSHAIAELNIETQQAGADVFIGLHSD